MLHVVGFCDALRLGCSNPRQNALCCQGQAAQDLKSLSERFTKFGVHRQTMIPRLRSQASLIRCLNSTSTHALCSDARCMSGLKSVAVNGSYNRCSHSRESKTQDAFLSES